MHAGVFGVAGSGVVHNRHCGLKHPQINLKDGDNYCRPLGSSKLAGVTAR